MDLGFFGLNLGLSGSQLAFASVVPQIRSSAPADGEIDVQPDVAIAITFNVNIAAGTGNIVLRDVTGAVDEETFDIALGTGDNGGTVAVAGKVLTITPGAAMAAANAYAVHIAATAIDNALDASVSYPGITDDTTLNFDTVVVGQIIGIIPFLLTKNAA